MRLLDYIKTYTIDLSATEGLDYLIEVVNEDLVKAVDCEDYEEAKRLQDMIESLPVTIWGILTLFNISDFQVKPGFRILAL